MYNSYLYQIIQVKLQFKKIVFIGRYSIYPYNIVLKIVFAFEGNEKNA